MSKGPFGSSNPARPSRSSVLPLPQRRSSIGREKGLYLEWHALVLGRRCIQTLRFQPALSISPSRNPVCRSDHTLGWHLCCLMSFALMSQTNSGEVSPPVSSDAILYPWALRDSYRLRHQHHCAELISSRDADAISSQVLGPSGGPAL